MGTTSEFIQQLNRRFTVFWDMTPCRMVEKYQSLGETCYLLYSILKIQIAGVENSNLTTVYSSVDKADFSFIFHSSFSSSVSAAGPPYFLIITFSFSQSTFLFHVLIHKAVSGV
jgi:hypothetical protein